MNTVVILVYPGVCLGQVCGMQDYFRFCNDLARHQSPQLGPLYQVKLMHIDGALHYLDGFIELKCQPLALDQASLLLIPGSYAHSAEALLATTRLFAEKQTLLHSVHQNGVPIAASCNGSFALAATGLLNDKTATTCWFLADFFRELYPAVHLAVDEKIQHSNGLYTAGATSAYIELCLSLTQQQQGARFSQQMAKIMLTDPQCASQAPYLTLQQLLPHQDDKIAQVQQYLRKHLSENIELSQLADHFALTPRTLLRRFKQSTGDTPMAYLQKLRIEKAKQLLESSLLPVEQLLTVVGYEDVSSFRKLFQQYTSLTPKAYRERFYLADRPPGAERSDSPTH